MPKATSLVLCPFLLSVSFALIQPASAQTSGPPVVSVEAGDSMLARADAAFHGLSPVVDVQLQGTVTSFAGDPQLYFTQLLVNLPQIRMRELATWLPDQWKLRQTARLATLKLPLP